MLNKPGSAVFLLAAARPELASEPTFSRGVPVHSTQELEHQRPHRHLFVPIDTVNSNGGTKMPPKGTKRVSLQLFAFKKPGSPGGLGI